jgi:cytochrome c2
MSLMRTRLLLLAAVTAVGILAGCNKDSSTKDAGSGTPPPGPTGGPPEGSAKAFDADSEPHSDGKKVMVQSGCFRCHAVDGARPAGGQKGPAGPPMGGRGGPGGPDGGGRGRGPGAPDLGHVASDPAHTADWLTKYIQDPKSVKSDSKMPKFEGKMSEGDLKNLVEYLASLK